MDTVANIIQSELDRGMKAARNYLRTSDTTHNTIVQRYHEAEAGLHEAFMANDFERFSYLLGMASVLGDVVDS
jgi:hypothetical protein